VRRGLLDRGLSVSTPDAHVAPYALDRDGDLSKDAGFARMARFSALRVGAG